MFALINDRTINLNHIREIEGGLGPGNELTFVHSDGE
jgi:hypothetical protein